MASGERATSQETIEALLERSGRDHLPLAKRFVQHRDQDDRGTPGPLARFVSRHHERGLQQYLLAHAVASGGDWDVTFDSQIWARALGLNERRLSSRNAVSRNWAWLERAQLIERSRRGRKARITLLYDDGSGESYQHPHHRRPREAYLQLPYAFWRQEWHRKLDLAGIAVLLILLAEKPGRVQLVAERIPRWYGISTSTFEKGVQTLRRADLLQRTFDKVAAPLSPVGFTTIYSYRLLDAFERPEPESKS